MANSWFKPVSPLVGWFILMDLVCAACIVGFWIELAHHSVRPWNRVGLGVIVTVLYIGSNVLLLRRRRWAWAGFVICWLLMALMLWPAL